MGWIFVIEENQSLYDQIEDAVSQIEPQLAIIRFNDNKSFLDWMTGLVQNDPHLQPPAPKGEFRGIITAVEPWKFKDVKLIGKFKALFLQKGLAADEDELGVVFTGYESEFLHKKRFEHRAVNNFIYKPFDKIVLRQVLEIAFSGRHAIKKYFVHNLKMNSTVEMLKEISLTGLTELGFQTVSDQSIEPGKISKYYAQFLETDQHRSALAQVLTFESQATINVELRFFALDQQQSFNLQKLVREKSTLQALGGVVSTRENFEFIFVTHPKSALSQELMPSFERFFDHPVRAIDNLIDLNRELQLMPGEVAPEIRKFIFVDRLHVIGNEVAELQGIRNGSQFPALSLFLLSPKIFPEATELALSPICEDIFYPPFNKSYFIKGLKQRWPHLKVKEDLFAARRELEQRIHVSNQVKMVQVSEAGLVIEYARELALGGFREFVFWMPNEVDVPTLIAQCNFNAPVEGKNTFHCHFVFFGLRDVELKFIRLWMKHQYIEAKQKSNRSDGPNRRREGH